MSNTEIGISIFNSIQLVEKAGQEINSLLDMIQAELDHALASDELTPILKTADSWKYSERLGESGWAFTDCALSIGLGKRSNNPKRYLSIQVSLSGDGMHGNFLQNQEPLLHVYFGEERLDFDEDTYLDMALGDVDSTPEIQEKVLLNWYPNAETWNEQDWAYSIQITSINTITDIRDKIIFPFSQIVSGATILEIGLSDIEGVIHYSR